MPANSDLARASYYFKVLLRSAPMLILLACSGLPFFVVLLLWLLFALLVGLVAGRLGRCFANLLHGTGQRDSGPATTTAAELDKARFHKRAGRHPEALHLINSVLEHYPQHPAALLLKAELLWQGFANQPAALACLDRLLIAPATEERYRYWAQQLRQEIASPPEAAPSFSP